MAIHPRIVATRAMADIGKNSGGAPGWKCWWGEIPVIPPVEPRRRIQTIPVHARYGRLGNFGRFYAVFFEEVTEVYIILSIPAIGLGCRGVGRKCVVES